MHEIKNLTNSPFDLETLDGPKRLPAMGAVSGTFEPAYLASLRSFGMYEVREVGEPKSLITTPRKGKADLTKQVGALKKPAR